MKRLTCALLCLLLLLSSCVPAAEVTPTPTPTPTPEVTPTPTPEPSPQGTPSEEPSSILYINRELDFTMEIPLSWQGRVVIDDNYTTDTRNGGQYVTVYQKATYEQGLDGPDGALFSIGRYPGQWTEDEPPVYAGGCVLVMETEDFTYFAITPSDVRWVESDAEIQADYADLVSQFSFVWSHISVLDPSSALNPSQEPPLTAQELSMPVPDFLTEEQQALYRRARALYSRVRGGNTLAIDFPEELPSGTSYDEGIDQNGYHYVKSLGRYSRWADFEAVMLSVFTQEFWDSINTLPDGNQIYIDVNGSMYLIDFGMGSGLYYNPYISDEYVLLEQSDTQVSFLLVGHYVFDALPREDETAEQYRDRLSQGWDYTLEFPIRLVLTENGWRFQEFHSTFCDEEGPSELSQEPPLTAEALSIPVPDFLTEDQQYLYRRAYSLYVNAFGGYPRNLDAIGVTDPEARLDILSSQPAVSIDGAPYLLSVGRYQNWEDFDRVVHSLFTDRFWKEINHSEPSSDGDLPRFVPREDGRLCFLDMEWFQDGSYNKNFPDTFRLEEQTDTTVTFTLIGHYSDIYLRDGETPEDRDARLARQYDYTVEYPIKLVLTADGWRFDVFACAAAAF